MVNKGGIHTEKTECRFTEEEMNAMKEKVSEMKSKISGRNVEKDVLDKIENMEDEDRKIAMKSIV